MAPKTSKTSASDDVTSGTTLTPKETQILLAVVSLMPEVPDVSHGLIILSFLIALEQNLIVK